MRSITGYELTITFIYCYNREITINRITRSCPTYPFRVPNTESYELLNVNHAAKAEKIIVISDGDIVKVSNIESS